MSVVGTSLSDLSLSGFFHFKEVFNERNSNSDRKQHTALFPQDHRQDHLCGACPFQRNIQRDYAGQNQASAP